MSGRVAVAVAAEVERVDVAAARDEQLAATGAQMRPWKPVGWASSTGAPVPAPVVHGEVSPFAWKECEVGSSTAGC